MGEDFTEYLLLTVFGHLMRRNSFVLFSGVREEDCDLWIAKVLPFLYNKCESQ